MSVIRSFWNGWSAATQLWPVVLLAYLVETAVAAILAMPPAMQLARVFGHSSMAPSLLGPISLDWLLEATDNADTGLFPWWPLYLLVPPVYLLLVTFLRGGILGSLARDASEFNWRDFFSDCVRFFWRLLLLSLFYIPLAIAFTLVYLILTLPLELAGPSELAVGVRLALAPLLFVLLMAVLDYARVSLVLEPRRSFLRHAGRGLWFSLRRFYLVIPLAIAFALVAALFAVAYPGLLRLDPSFNELWPALLVQQLSILGLAWQRIATLGGEMALYRGSTRRAD